MKDAVKTIIGKRIKGIVTKERPDRSPCYQLFLIFSDDTYFEFYSTHGNIHCAGGIDKGGINAVRNYLGEQFITLESCDESIVDRPMETGNKQEEDALAELILEDPEEAIRMLVTTIEDLRGEMTRRDQELQVRLDAFEKKQQEREAANPKKDAAELILEDPEEAIRMLVTTKEDRTVSLAALKDERTRRQELQVRIDAFERERQEREAAHPKKGAAELILEDPEEAFRTLVTTKDELRGEMTRPPREGNGGLPSMEINGKKANGREELIRKLEGADFQAAAKNIAYTFRVAEEKAASKGGSYIAKEEFINAVDHYMEKPNLENALILLEAYPSFIKLFELNKDPLQIWARNFRKSHE